MFITVVADMMQIISIISALELEPLPSRMLSAFHRSSVGVDESGIPQNHAARGHRHSFLNAATSLHPIQVLLACLDVPAEERPLLLLRVRVVVLVEQSVGPRYHLHVHTFSAFWLVRKLDVQREDLDQEMKENEQKKCEILMKKKLNDWRMKPGLMKTVND
jgi:hypothetical protein